MYYVVCGVSLTPKGVLMGIDKRIGGQRLPERILLRLAGMHDFVWLHQGEEQATEPQATSVRAAQ